MGQKGCYDVVDDDDALLIQDVALEQAAVEVGCLADDLVNARAVLLRGAYSSRRKTGRPAVGRRSRLMPGCPGSRATGC